MKVVRKFTKAGEDVYSKVAFARRTSRISNVDGTVVFEMKDAEIPADWSQLATDIMVSKYFRKAGVPEVDAQGKPVLDANGKPKTGPEKSVRQVVHRLAGCWTQWGRDYGYFSSSQDADAVYDELACMMLHQMAAPNSPQWFNTGLNFAYAMTGPSQGHWFVNPKTLQLEQSNDAYTHPQPHACFIQSVNDDLVNDGGIMDLWVREARLFKYGSGTGTNFSHLRGENESLSGGGKSSGLMSFLKIGDRAAGAIKSGGTTRRAAKMVCLDLDHPDISEFVNWKVREELKVAALVEGLKHLPREHQELATKLKLKLDYDFNGEAYATVSGQNSNNSVRVPNKFVAAVEKDASWDLIRRTDQKVHKTIKARDLWQQIAFAAWRCADPGVQYDDTINEWHTCPQSGRINASNPCSEYMFLDNTACNLASINLMKFFDAAASKFDIEGFQHACRLWTMVLEISVLMAAYPSREIARLSYEYRTLGLGYANIGTMLMVAGIPYDSAEGRAICGAITALMTAESYAASAELAGELGPFPGYHRNRTDMLRVMRNHRAAANDGQYESLEIKPGILDDSQFTGATSSPQLLAAAREAWDRAVALGEKFGYRNAQTTVIAPTGTIGLLMDCDTTGVEPDFALVKFKKLAGGGYFKIANQSVEPALRNLGYSEPQIKDILTYVLGTLSLKGSPHINQETLKAKGFTDDELAKIEACLPSVFELAFAFSPWTLGEAAMTRLGFTTAQSQEPSFNLLRAMGFTRRQIREANDVICGSQTVEGAPHLKDEHLAVFDCANRCGRKGKRFIHHLGHIRMMAAAQPFISGAISKTINLPNEVNTADIEEAYRESWKLGLKAVALYRDGSKLSQPLNSMSDDDASDDSDIDALKIEAALACTTCGDPSPAVPQQAEADASPTAKAAAAKSVAAAPIVERIEERVIDRPLRRRLPDTRPSITHKFDINGHEGYITCGLFEDGSPGEVFITMAKQGSTVGGLMDAIATLISLNLQYGVPLSAMVRKFEHMRFEPAGMTRNGDIPFAKSVMDYLVRWLGMQFLPGYRAENAPKRGNHHEAVVEHHADDAAAHSAKLMDVTPPSLANGYASPAGNGNGNGNGNGHGHGNGSGNGNGHGNGAKAHSDRMALMQGGTATQVDALSQHLATMMGDAPNCSVCGNITVRNGSCYKCNNCGTSQGCS
ncbi:MAG: adenosylcobalamin-dependent ribonucleoside-diphosphate reductase [Phycisphaerales bacterium]|nr:adenosylcobalamin-dependent ribonucleoside-diphosphate reductase [Phycisphaerales bacterium]